MELLEEDVNEDRWLDNIIEEEKGKNLFHIKTSPTPSSDFFKNTSSLSDVRNKLINARASELVVASTALLKEAYQRNNDVRTITVNDIRRIKEELFDTHHLLSMNSPGSENNWERKCTRLVSKEALRSFIVDTLLYNASSVDLLFSKMEESFVGSNEVHRSKAISRKALFQEKQNHPKKPNIDSFSWETFIETILQEYDVLETIVSKVPSNCFSVKEDIIIPSTGTPLTLLITSHYAVMSVLCKSPYVGLSRKSEGNRTIRMKKVCVKSSPTSINGSNVIERIVGCHPLSFGGGEGFLTWSSNGVLMIWDSCFQHLFDLPVKFPNSSFSLTASRMLQQENSDQAVRKRQERENILLANIRTYVLRTTFNSKKIAAQKSDVSLLPPEAPYNSTRESLGAQRQARGTIGRVKDVGVFSENKKTRLLTLRIGTTNKDNFIIDERKRAAFNSAVRGVYCAFHIFKFILTEIRKRKKKNQETLKSDTIKKVLTDTQKIEHSQVKAVNSGVLHSVSDSVAKYRKIHTLSFLELDDNHVQQIECLMKSNLKELNDKPVTKIITQNKTLLRNLYHETRKSAIENAPVSNVTSTYSPSANNLLNYSRRSSRRQTISMAKEGDSLFPIVDKSQYSNGEPGSKEVNEKEKRIYLGSTGRNTKSKIRISQRIMKDDPCSFILLDVIEKGDTEIATNLYQKNIAHLTMTFPSSRKGIHSLNSLVLGREEETHNVKDETFTNEHCSHVTATDISRAFSLLALGCANGTITFFHISSHASTKSYTTPHPEDNFQQVFTFQACGKSPSADDGPEKLLKSVNTGAKQRQYQQRQQEKIVETIPTSLLLHSIAATEVCCYAGFANGRVALYSLPPSVTPLSSLNPSWQNVSHPILQCPLGEEPLICDDTFSHSSPVIALRNVPKIGLVSISDKGTILISSALSLIPVQKISLSVSYPILVTCAEFDENRLLVLLGSTSGGVSVWSLAFTSLVSAFGEERYAASVQSYVVQTYIINQDSILKWKDHGNGKWYQKCELDVFSWIVGTAEDTIANDAIGGDGRNKDTRRGANVAMVSSMVREGEVKLLQLISENATMVLVTLANGYLCVYKNFHISSKNVECVLKTSVGGREKLELEEMGERGEIACCAYIQQYGILMVFSKQLYFYSLQEYDAVLLEGNQKIDISPELLVLSQRKKQIISSISYLCDKSKVPAPFAPPGSSPSLAAYSTAFRSLNDNISKKNAPLHALAQHDNKSASSSNAPMSLVLFSSNDQTSQEKLQKTEEFAKGPWDHHINAATSYLEPSSIQHSTIEQHAIPLSLENKGIIVYGVDERSEGAQSFAMLQNGEDYEGFVLKDSASKEMRKRSMDKTKGKTSSIVRSTSMENSKPESMLRKRDNSFLNMVGAKKEYCSLEESGVIDIGKSSQEFYKRIKDLGECDLQIAASIPHQMMKNTFNEKKISQLEESVSIIDIVNEVVACISTEEKWLRNINTRGENENKEEKGSHLDLNPLSSVKLQQTENMEKQDWIQEKRGDREKDRAFGFGNRLEETEIERMLEGNLPTKDLKQKEVEEEKEKHGEAKFINNLVSCDDNVTGKKGLIHMKTHGSQPYLSHNNFLPNKINPSKLFQPRTKILYQPLSLSSAASSITLSSSTSPTSLLPPAQLMGDLCVLDQGSNAHLLLIDTQGYCQLWSLTAGRVKSSFYLSLNKESPYVKAASDTMSKTIVWVNSLFSLFVTNVYTGRSLSERSLPDPDLEQLRIELREKLSSKLFYEYGHFGSGDRFSFDLDISDFLTGSVLSSNNPKTICPSPSNARPGTALGSREKRNRKIMDKVRNSFFSGIVFDEQIGRRQIQSASGQREREGAMGKCARTIMHRKIVATPNKSLRSTPTPALTSTIALQEGDIDKAKEEVTKYQKLLKSYKRDAGVDFMNERLQVTAVGISDGDGSIYGKGNFDGKKKVFIGIKSGFIFCTDLHTLNEGEKVGEENENSMSSPTAFPTALPFLSGYREETSSTIKCICLHEAAISKLVPMDTFCVSLDIAGNAAIWSLKDTLELLQYFSIEAITRSSFYSSSFSLPFEKSDERSEGAKGDGERGSRGPTAISFDYMEESSKEGSKSHGRERRIKDIHMITPSEWRMNIRPQERRELDDPSDKKDAELSHLDTPIIFVLTKSGSIYSFTLVREMKKPKRKPLGGKYTSEEPNKGIGNTNHVQWKIKTLWKHERMSTDKKESRRKIFPGSSAHSKGSCVPDNQGPLNIDTLNLHNAVWAWSKSTQRCLIVSSQGEISLWSVQGGYSLHYLRSTEIEKLGNGGGEILSVSAIERTNLWAIGLVDGGIIMLNNDLLSLSVGDASPEEYSVFVNGSIKDFRKSVFLQAVENQIQNKRRVVLH